MAYKIRKDLAYRRIAGEVYIVDAAKSEMRELNGPAALIWEGLAAGKKGEAIASAIAEEFETDAATARADLAAFTEELLAARLIEKL
ncbi:MAG TPA: hypothetical protein DEQ38_10690 [Elusimicrobia bacterium]|nr:MAG: hypothetical protein A2089_14590 [Elusimicrobia bacterium GWD2_63_28]HCC48564.1 hypothetical protein [Elusimicrobiota bacterium]